MFVFWSFFPENSDVIRFLRYNRYVYPYVGGEDIEVSWRILPCKCKYAIMWMNGFPGCITLKEYKRLMRLWKKLGIDVDDNSDGKLLLWYSDGGIFFQYSK